MAKPFKKVRCGECNAPVKVVGHLWNKYDQAFDYQLADHLHRSVDPSWKEIRNITQKNKGWMGMFNFGRGNR
jgi:hypothetical protein